MGESTREQHTESRPGEPAGTSAQRARIAAARIVAYDAPDRTPDQRAAMLTRVGLTRIVWDWREEHALRFAPELDALERHGIAIVGLWCPMPLPHPGEPEARAALGVVDPHVRAQVEQLRRRALTPDLWTCVEFGEEGTPARLAPAIQRDRVRRVADHLEPLVRLAEDASMRVSLTNHLGWFGEPENQVEVIDELASRELTNVRIAYQFQHGHHHAHRFQDVLDVMRPHLGSIALSGVDPDGIQTGRKILPWGAGRMDRKLAHLVMASGWEGQIAVQGHSVDDVEPRLLDSLEGIAWMLDRWQGIRHARPVPRIATPAWPEPTGVGGPSMGMSMVSRRLRRRLVETGEIAPTLQRVRVAPPEPAPITLPQRQVDPGSEDTGSSAALEEEPADTHPRGVRTRAESRAAASVRSPVGDRLRGPGVPNPIHVSPGSGVSASSRSAARGA